MQYGHDFDVTGPGVTRLQEITGSVVGAEEQKKKGTPGHTIAASNTVVYQPNSMFQFWK